MLGLGLLGRGVNVAKFLASLGAELVITDLKTPEALEASVKQLKKYPNIHFVLGEHRLEDFRDRDLVIKAAGVPLDSPYVAEALMHNIPFEMDASIFAKFSPATIVGVTGTRGKTTTTHLLTHILETAFPGHAYIGGNIRGMATLPLLKKAKAGDYVVLELDSWQLQGFGDAKISPRLAVFTNFLHDHMNYYKGNMGQYFADKANIFTYQTENDVCVASEQAAREIKAHTQGLRSKLVVARKKIVPISWKLKIPGEHNRENIACVIEAARVLGVPEKAIKKAVESFKGIPGRLEFLRSVRGVQYWNDTTATTPDGNRVAIQTLTEKGKKNLVLIAGGNDKNLEFEDMVKLIHRTVKALIFIKGTATEKILALIPKKHTYPLVVVESMREAVAYADGFAEKGDTVLLSPGAASFGVFKNEYDRGDQFAALVKKIV